MDDVKIIATIVPRTQGEPSVLNGGLLKVLPTDTDYATLLTNKLKGYDGRKLEVTFCDPESWTIRMNDLFHALVRKLMKSGQLSYWDKIRRAPANFEEVKAWVKIELGGAEVRQVGDLSWIESWTNFSKKRALQTIDSVLNYCMEVGIDIDQEKLESMELK